MSTTPPEANSEYSRGSVPSRKASPFRFLTPAPPEAAAPKRSGKVAAAGVRALLLGTGVLGALLLVVAEFTTLFAVRTHAAGPPLRTVTTGAHNAYAMIPIAVLAAVLAYAVWRAASRPALLALGLVGVIALLIALLGDLPDAHASGLLTNAAGHYVIANSKASAGMYMETLGAVVLVITCVCGFLLMGAPARPAQPIRDRATGR